jgi:lipopolysaccharide cholinephosphotransferase
MKLKITAEQLRAIQLKQTEALLEVDRICRERGLQYYLAYGTLLGAVRHKSFIPWDDDLDIMMPRKDYEIFLKKGSQWLKKGFFLQNFRTTPECSCQITEIRIDGTVMKQSLSESLDIHHGIFIDILPMDYISPNLLKRSIDRFLLRTLMTMCYAKIGHQSTKNPLFAIMSKALSTLFPLRTLRAMTEALSKKYESRPTEMVCAPLSPYALCTAKKDVLPYELFNPPTQVEFEGHFFSAPKNPDAILRQIYGDYMNPPPEEQRLLRHNIIELQI